MANEMRFLGSLATAPTGHIKSGFTYYDTVDEVLKTWNGTEWVNSVDTTNFATASTTRVYRVSLGQSGTSNPTATELENSMGGTIAWTRIGVGAYRATITGATFPASLFMSNVVGLSGNDEMMFGRLTRTSNTVVDLALLDINTVTPVEFDGGPALYVEIIAYP